MADGTSFFVFDEANITWSAIPWLEHVQFYVYNVDEPRKIVDVIFKMGAHKRAMLHRHKVPYVTLVIQGELRLYRPNGDLKEIRTAGSYVSGEANGEPHTEGGGDQDVIAFFSNRNVDGILYEFLDDDGNVVESLGIADFKAAFDAQVESGAALKVAARAA